MREIKPSQSTVQRLRGWVGRTFKQRQDEVTFRCNICGQPCSAKRADFGRETPSCRTCGSTVRMRSIVHALSLELFGECLALPDFPQRPDLRGAGMSDWEGYARPLAEKLDYRNTFLHQEPFLDILAPRDDELGTLDFLISTDVYEHVTPPVGMAFENARRLLKPGGVFLFSVPYNLEGATLEHYPDLHDFRIEEAGGEFVLHNTTRAGERQSFRDLIFHGGPGSTLELRVFSLPDLLAHFRAAGFASPVIHAEAHGRCGMLHDCGWSLTMSARPRA